MGQCCQSSNADSVPGDEDPASPRGGNSQKTSRNAEVKVMIEEKRIEGVQKEYHFGRTLGSGASCTVVEGSHLQNNDSVAIKIMDALRPVTEKLYRAEIEILSRLSLNTQRYRAASVAMANEYHDQDTKDLIRKYTPMTDNAGWDNVLHFVGHSKEKESCYVLTQLLTGGELFDRIVTKSVDYKVNGYLIAGRLVKQMLESIKYCHDHDIVHRDLKPENFVFLTKDVNSLLVLIDYGCAQVLDDQNSDKQKIVGTAYYLAPELAFNAWYTYWLKMQGHSLDEVTRKQQISNFMNVVEQKIKQRADEFSAMSQRTDTSNEPADGKDTEEMLHLNSHKDNTPLEKNDDPSIPLLQRYTNRTSKMLKAADIWSIGVIAYVMLTGRAPFRGRDNRQIFESIVTREWRFPAKDARYGDPITGKNVPEQFRKFLDKCLQKDPLMRPNVDELLNDPFVQGVDTKSYTLNAEVLKYIKQFNYQSRLKKAITQVLAQNMTEQPARQVDMHFKRVDANDDGMLNEEELIQVCQDSGYDNVMARVMAKRAVQQFDADGDGKINPDEFKQMWYSKVLSENDNYIARVFEVFDDNGDGFIDKEELKMILFSDVNKGDYQQNIDNNNNSDDNSDNTDNKTDDPFAMQVMDMINEVDKNKDGKISFDEFFDAMTEKTNNEKFTSGGVDNDLFAFYGRVGGNVELDVEAEKKYPTEHFA